MDDEASESLTADSVDPSDVDAVCFSSLLNTPGGIYFFKDRHGRFIRVSVDCAALTNRTPEEMIGLTDFDLTDPEHAAELAADERHVIATGESIIDKEEIDRLANQPGTWVETSKFPLRDAAGGIVGTFGYSRDVTRWELAEGNLARMADAFADANAKLQLVESQLRAILNNSTDGIAKYDRDLRYQYINPAGELFRGLRLDELLGRTDRELGMAEDLLEPYEKALTRVLATGEPVDIEFPGLNQPDGEEWFHLSLSPDLDATGAVVGVLTSTRDITQIKRAERAMSYQAMHDPLTGLANRHLLMDRLDKSLSRLVRRPGRLAVLFIDLDRLKDVNDSFGHEVGDRALVEVARRLERVARREDTVARIGGDEFVMLCDDPTLDVHHLAERVVRALGEPYNDGSLTFPLSASVGAAVAEDASTSPDELLNTADAAMYRAKVAGRNRFEVTDPAR